VLLAADVDSDGDGIPDIRDSRPHVATYYKCTAPVGQNPLLQSATTDSDGDGLPDMVDSRPYVASYYKLTAPQKHVLADQPADADTDGDGLRDRLDNRPIDATYYKNTAPPKADPLSQPADVDSDNDGLPDRLDNRPYVATYYKAYVAPAQPMPEPKPEAKPEPKPEVVQKPLDSDGDGVPDDQDQCPNTPPGVKVDAHGCPLDSDGDGVPDYLDKCPNTPKGVPVDANGCPTIIKKGEKITLQIEFANNSYEMDAGSKERLDGIAETLRNYPEIKIDIRGFTDNVGSTAHNKTLSESRAKAVLTYLEGKGVVAERMTSQGFGKDPKHFIADNKTAAGRQQNRRVEIVSVD
jgi:OOP family OmpA-OmpF porin